MANEFYSEENFKKMKKLLKERVPEKRYEHSKRVSKACVQLAEIYGVDEDKARMAGLLHDWDKGLTLNEIRRRVAIYGVPVDPVVVESMPWLLHGPTAAAALGEEFPDLDKDVLQAISRHTSGDRNMTDLDMVVYIADLVEPGRKYKNVKEVRRACGRVSLEELYFLSFKNILQFLVSQNRPIHPNTIEVWNYLADHLKGSLTEGAFDADTQLEALPSDWVSAERQFGEAIRGLE